MSAPRTTQLLTKAAEGYVQYTPGIYSMARRVRSGIPGVAVPESLGLHRFLFLVPEDPDKYKDHLVRLPGGQQGIVIGAYNRPGLDGRVLRAKKNDPSDVEALREVTDRYGSANTYGTRLRRIRLQADQELDDKISRLIEANKAYQRATEENPVYYPDTLANLRHLGRNSNTYVRSILNEAGLGDSTTFEGLPTPGSRLRLPRRLFKTSSVTDAVLSSLGPLSVVTREAERYLGPTRLDLRDDGKDDVDDAIRYIYERQNQYRDREGRQQTLGTMLRDMSAGAAVGGGLGAIKGYTGEGKIGPATKWLGAAGAGLGAAAPAVFHLSRDALKNFALRRRPQVIRSTPNWIRDAVKDPDLVHVSDTAADSNLAPLLNAEIGSLGLGVAGALGAHAIGAGPTGTLVGGLGGTALGGVAGWIHGLRRRRVSRRLLQRALRRYQREHAVGD